MAESDRLSQSEETDSLQVFEESEAASPRPLVSIVIPAHNEAGILQQNLSRLCDYLDSLKDRYHWEILLVNDGSTDDTGEQAEAFAATREDLRVLHHRRNFGLGQALQYGLNCSRGDYIVTLDIDLSYAPDHIEKLLQTAQDTGAKVVAASPYMKGGQLSHVPRLRRTLSIWANRFLSVAASGDLSTLTGMVRVYDGCFVRSVNVRATGPEINPELIHKAMMLNARIEEIPAHLDWGPQIARKGSRTSSLRILRQMIAVLLSGFLFRPVAFFILPGIFLLALGIYSSTWVIIHFFRQFTALDQYTWVMDRASAAAATAFEQFPHTFVVAGVAMMLAIQLIGLGVLALQSKSYFEELFHFSSKLYQGLNRPEDN